MNFLFFIKRSDCCSNIISFDLDPQRNLVPFCLFLRKRANKFEVLLEIPKIFLNSFVFNQKQWKLCTENKSKRDNFYQVLMKEIKLFALKKSLNSKKKEKKIPIIFILKRENI